MTDAKELMKPAEARKLLANCGAMPYGDNFYAMPSDVTGRLFDLAHTLGYRRPKNANGSTARYFHARLLRIAAQSK